MLIVLFIALLALIFLSVPVVVAIGAVALGGILALPELAPVEFPRKMFAAVDSFSLLALPYFILAGELMVRGGMSRRLVEFAETLVGHLRGGLGHATVLANMIFANVTGSSVASTSAIGSLMAPEMKARGYKGGFIASLAATSGVIGAIIPPSMVMVVYGSIAQVSVGGLFLGGIIPGILVGLFLMATIKIYSFHPDYPELRVTHGNFSWLAVGRSLRTVWPALMGPVIIVGGILSGVFTATEAGAVACLYALLLGMFYYRKIRLADLPAILIESAVMTTMVSGVIAVAGASGWLLAYLEFNAGAVTFVTSFSQDPTVVLLIVAVVMIVLGTFVDSLAVLLIFAPVAIQISKTYGIDPIQMGLVMVMCNQIGAVSPPTAPLLFVTTSIAQTTFSEVNRHVWWFMLAETLVLLLVIFIPGLASWIPRYFLG